MEFKDGVMYVAPNGLAMNKEQFNKIKNTVEDTWNFIKKVVETIADALKTAVRKLIDLFKKADVKAMRKQIDDKRIMHQSWHVPKNTMRNHQVMNRKPMFTHIRNNI